MKRPSLRCSRQRPTRGGRFAALGLFIFAGGALAGEAYRPAADAVVLERLPALEVSNQRELAELRTRLAAAPNDLSLAVELSSRYSALGSAEGDPRYYAYAQAALRPWWDMDSPPPQVRLQRAIYLQHRHDFDAALAELEHVLRQSPRSAQAWLTRAMILRVQGRYAEAGASCRALLTVADPALTTLCLTSINSLSGRLQASYDQLKDVVARRLSPEHRQWAQTALAQMAEQLGDAPAAERHYREALATPRRDVYLLAAYSDFLLDQRQSGQVRKLLAEETAADPLLLRLALAERQLGDERWRAHAGLLQRRFEAVRAREGEGHLREGARAALALEDEPARALDLATANWRRQREPEDARLVLAAALAAGKPEAAAPVLAWLDESKLEDARLAPLRRRLKETP
jgi:tetratricopeptide (TPR) repeat protein